MDRWMITKESRELTVDFSIFSSIDVVHRPRTPPSMQPDPILNSFHSVSTFRHNFIIKRFAILRDRLSSKRRRIETVWQIIEERGEGKRREGREAEETRNLAGGFHHRRDGTRRLQDVSDLSIFSTRSTMNVPVSEPLLGQTGELLSNVWC